MKKLISALISALIFSGGLIACTSFDKPKYDALVQKQCGIAPHCFDRVQAAIDAAPTINVTPYRIFIANGDYVEKITIAKNNIFLIGQSAENTHLVFGDYAGKKSASGKILTTPNSATLTIRAKDILLTDLTVKNSFDYVANDALNNENSNYINGSQAVALFIDTPSDRVLARNVILWGNQDTLFVNSGRSWFDKSLIAGNVDYIFGAGNTLFTDSEIRTLMRGKYTNPHGFITAPSTSIKSNYGLTFLHCRLTRDKNVPDNSTPLGRPWHPTTQFSDGRYADPSAIGKSVFIHTWMDKHITLAGWYSMSGIAKLGGKKKFMPEDSRFFEYENTGSGAFINDKRRQLKSEEVKNFTKENIFGDWNPR